MLPVSTRLRALLVVSALCAGGASATAACTAAERADLAEGADGGGIDATSGPRELREPAAPLPASPDPVEKPAVVVPFVTNFAAGSLIIPMDVTYQDTGMLKAFGLLDKLLRAGIPVSWVIDPNKVVVNTATGTFTVDMTASATDFQTKAVISSYGYRGGPFVVDSTNAAQATPIIQAWQKTNTTTVHVASAAFSGPVSRLLTAAPRIAVFNDGNQQIAFSYLNAAGVLDEQGLVWGNNSVDLLTDVAVTGTLADPQDGVLFGKVSGGQPQFCEIMTMHWDVNSMDIPGVVAEMNSFLNYPVHVNAECQAVNAVEGQPPDGGREDWLTTQGYQWPAPKQPMSVQFSNSQLPFAQMDGPFATVGGSEPAYGFAPGSSYYFQDNVMIRGAGVGVGVQDLWMTGFAHGSCDIRGTSPGPHPFIANTCAGKVSYLGGHQYGVNTPMSKNPQSQGARLFLNSLFEAACVTSEGQPVISLTKSAPSSVSSANVTYTITYGNTGPGPALAFVLKDTIPTGSTFVSASSPGAFAGGVVSWSFGDLPSGAAGTVSFVVALPAKGTYTNQASSTFKVGNNVQTATSNTTTTVWGSCTSDANCPAPLVCDTTTSNCVQCTTSEQQNCADAGSGVCQANDTCGCTVSTNCPTGDTCVSGKCVTCAQSCTTGCCTGAGACTTPSLAACGAGGAVCLVCDPTESDSCTAGKCACGTHAACGVGQACVGGACVCTATSCANGCCNGTTCNSPSVAACGSAGAACIACNPAGTDGCNGGKCSCGSGAACGAGQACVNGACVCNAGSCPNGCCNGTTCTTPSSGACGSGGSSCVACTGGGSCTGGACSGCTQTCAAGCCSGNSCNTPSAAACGAAGGACIACNPATADSCKSGACACGSGAPCAAGQQCVNGACACNAASCPNGCCAGTTCTPLSATACGAPGAACEACTGGGQCLGGVCTGCSQTCTTGCCSGNDCSPPSTATCGSGGGTCLACNPGASDSCTNGACTCGAGAACGAAQQCTGGTCVTLDAGADGSDSGSGGDGGSGSGSGSGSGGDSGTGSGSGSSSGSGDSGTGSGSGGSSGSSSGGDSGTGSGSGGSSGSSGASSGTASDSGSADAADAGTGTPGASSGCGCKTATGAPSNAGNAAWGLLALGIALGRRRRRSR